MTRMRAAAGSLLFLAAAPGVVAGVIPWWLTSWDSAEPPALFVVLGALMVGAGTVVLLHAFARFVIDGVGTPAPVAPTEHLVIGGAYRYVRNPMYIAVGGVIAGQALMLGRPILLAYVALFALAVHAFVRLYEEPTLRARYGDEYDHYVSTVPRWLPKPAFGGPFSSRRSRNRG